MIFYLGGCTFDVSVLTFVLTLDNGIFTTLAIDGDHHLGGEDFDNTLVSFCVDLFAKRNGVDIS